MIILAYIIGVFFGYLLGVYMGRRSVGKHQHIWKVLDSSTLNVYEGGTRHPNQLPIKRSTQILKGCFCGETKMDEINGHWNLEKLKALEV